MCRASQEHLINMGFSLSVASVKTGEKTGRTRDKRLENSGAGLDAVLKVNQTQSNLIAAKRVGMDEDSGARVTKSENAFRGSGKRDKMCEPGASRRGVRFRKVVPLDEGPCNRSVPSRPANRA